MCEENNFCFNNKLRYAQFFYMVLIKQPMEYVSNNNFVQSMIKYKNKNSWSCLID